MVMMIVMMIGAKEGLLKYTTGNCPGGLEENHHIP
jgi:hypothetical protein